MLYQRINGAFDLVNRKERAELNVCQDAITVDDISFRHTCGAVRLGDACSQVGAVGVCDPELGQILLGYPK